MWVDETVKAAEAPKEEVVVKNMQAVFSELIATQSSLPAEVAPYVHTPTEALDAFCTFGGFQETDCVVEIGSGDGRLLEELAHSGISVTGFEIDPEAIADCQQRIAALATTSPEQAARISLRSEDAFTADFNWSAVDVVYAYLTRRGLKQVWSTLVQRLRPGTRVVTIQFQPPSPMIINRQATFSWMDHRNQSCDFTFFEYII